MLRRFVTRAKKLKSTSAPVVTKIFSQKPAITFKQLKRYLTWRRVLRGGIIAVVAGILFSVGVFAWYYKDLPRPGELRSRSASESTILYDRNGKQIYDISGDERRILIKSNEIPEIMKKATVAIEDKNFYSHFGVDFRGLFRAVIFQGRSGGGSTITQQYIKNAILSPQRSITRKLKEIILAIELEAVYSKDDILTLYLNEIPYGANIYGVEAASQSFFGHSAKEGLTLSEAATLASIPQAPTRYSPYGNGVDLLIGRKNRVLDAMVKNGSISEEEAKKAKSEAPLVAKDFKQKRENFPAPHFVMFIREQLVQKYGEQLVQRGGLRVTTTLDLDMQDKADTAVKDGQKTLTSVKASNAGLVAIDPKTGQILAMVGSVDYFDREHEGNFNVATAERQPGSAGKPIVYATLFKGKWSPSSVLWDVQTDFNGYKPNNFDSRFHGPMTIRTALGNSFNIPAVKALQIAGIKDFLNTARDLGITTLDKKTDAGLSLALGGGEVKLVDLTSAYAVMANKGERAPMTGILKIQDSRGKVLDEWKGDTKQVLAPEIAYEVMHMLSDTDAKKPTFTRLLNVLSVSGKTVAVKTGTTNSYKDAWTVGGTPSIMAGVWAGNNNGDEMDHGGGSTAAAPIWHNFMAKVLADKPNEQFFRPSTITDYTVDFLSGKKPTPASGQLVQDIFAPWQLPTQDDDIHFKVKVCKSNGLLADSLTPQSEIEEKTYTRVHSEHPDNPSWENPVQAWARGNGLDPNIPTEKCSITISNPEIRITSPANGASVSGIFGVETENITPPGTTVGVSFYVDGTLVATDDSDPFTASINTSSLAPGNHTLRAVIQASNGNSGDSSITFVTAGDNTPPSDVSNATAIPTGNSSALVSWKNPSDEDVRQVSIYISQVSGVKGARFGTYNASPGAQQSTTVTGLTKGSPNYITINAVDASGNVNTSTKQISVTPL